MNTPRCITCKHFLLDSETYTHGVCRRHPPAHIAYPAELQEEDYPASLSEGFPKVLGETRCGEWEDNQCGTDYLRIGAYVTVEHEVLDDDGCILIADDEDRVFRIVGCSAPGMYDIMSAGTRRAYYYGSDSVELIKDYMPRCYATVMTGYLTPLQSRFEVGKIAELTEDFIIKDKVHEGYLTIEAGTPCLLYTSPSPRD